MFANMGSSRLPAVQIIRSQAETRISADGRGLKLHIPVLILEREFHWIFMARPIENKVKLDRL